MAVLEQTSRQADLATSKGLPRGRLVDLSMALVRRLSKGNPQPLPSFVVEDTQFLVVWKDISLFTGKQLRETSYDSENSGRPLDIECRCCNERQLEDGTQLVTMYCTATAESWQAGKRLDVTVSLLWDDPANGEVLRLCQVFVAESSRTTSKAIVTDASLLWAPQSARPVSPSAIALQASDTKGTTHWLTPSQVVYVEAAHQYTNVHCSDRVVRVRAPFGMVLKQLGDIVVQVHRSYAINPTYASHLSGEIIHLTTGDKVPVPTRRVKEVRVMLAQHFNKLGARG